MYRVYPHDDVEFVRVRFPFCRLGARAICGNYSKVSFFHTSRPISVYRRSSLDVRFRFISRKKQKNVLLLRYALVLAFGKLRSYTLRTHTLSVLFLLRTFQDRKQTKRKPSITWPFFISAIITHRHKQSVAYSQRLWFLCVDVASLSRRRFHILLVLWIPAFTKIPSH